MNDKIEAPFDVLFLRVADALDKTYDGRLEDFELKRFSEPPLTMGLVRAGLTHLTEKKLLNYLHDTRRRSAVDRFFWELTPAGGFALHEIRRSGLTSASTDGDQWSPIAVEESVEVARIEGAFSELTEMVRGDNGLAATEPDRHKGLLASFKAGIEILKSRAPSKDQLKSLLINPTIWISQKFGDNMIGQVARRAGNALAEWLGLPKVD